MKLMLDCLLLVLVVGYTYAQCPGRWTPVSGRCMQCGVGPLLDYISARAACQAAGGDLATIKTADQLAFAVGCSDALGTRHVWFGFTMRTSGGNDIYGWLDGTTETNPIPIAGVSVSPNFIFSCFALTPGNPTWDDRVCSATHHYACSRALITCASITPPDNAEIDYGPATSPFYMGNVATYSCEDGYSLNGAEATRTCQENSTWSGEEPACEAVDCGPLAAPINGQVATGATTYNSVATYSCNSGYSLGDVSSSSVCQADQTWSGSALLCSAMDCGTPPPPENGAVSISATTYRSTATYTCSGSYRLSGAATRTCTESGVWSGAKPICDNILAIGLGVSLGVLGFITIAAGLIYCLTRTSAIVPRAPLPGPGPLRNPSMFPRPGPAPVRPMLARPF